ncbi:hypothetical protein F5Y06DRAFT_306852 [Hypoxylon sp. FL0890]|nr:hypothetical protein F5Y06DRAFT_306852 [Hypoxylon sp. FL0890]
MATRQLWPMSAAAAESRKPSPMPTTATMTSTKASVLPTATTASSKTLPTTCPDPDSPAGPLNMNLFMDEPLSPALLRDLNLTPNPGVRGGPYALVWMDRPPLKIRLRDPSPEKKQVTSVSH